MKNFNKYLSDLLATHYGEAADGLVTKPPSRLARGEGTEKDYFIFKVDIARSTQLLFRRQKSTYLKFAHTFLSTIDRITQDMGADPAQVEYAGDGVMAYFPCDAASAEDVLTAACLSRAAVRNIKQLDSTLNSIPLQTRCVLHSGSLLVSRIGPWANSHLTAIGIPLHQVGHIEKTIGADIGRVTEQFYLSIAKDNKKFVSAVYDEKQVLVSSPPPPPPPLPQPPFGFGALLNPASRLSDLIAQTTLNTPPPAPTYRTERTLIGYNINWSMLEFALGITQLRLA